MLGLVLAVVVKSAFLAVFWWLKRLSPASQEDRYTPAELEEFLRQTRWRGLGIGLVFCLCMVFTGAVWTAMLTSVALLRFGAMPEHLLLVRPQPEFLVWAMPGLMLGMITSVKLSQLYEYLAYDEEYRRKSLAASCHQLKCDPLKFWGWLQMGICTIALAWFILQLDWYARLEADRIVVNPFFGLRESSYPYHRVQQLIAATHCIAPNGNLVERTKQYVIFDDGESYCHDTYLRDPAMLVELLEAKTGKKFKSVRFVEDALK